MARISRKLLDSFPEPLAVISETGEILATNDVLDRLTESCPERAWLADLFGPSIAGLIEDAGTQGDARGTFSMRRGHGTLYVRVALRSESTGRFHVQMTDVTEEMSWRTRLSERDQTLSVLQDVGSALSAAVDLDSLTEKVYEQTNRVIETENFYIALHDTSSDTISFQRYLEEGQWKSMTSRPFGTGLTEHVLNTKAPLVLNENVVERARELGVEPVGRPCLAWMGVPMVSEDKTIGVIGLQDYQRTNCYTPHNIKLLTVVAGQAAAAIRTTRLLAAARRAYRELSDAQARLLEAERLRGVTETVGALNHEVNNPLSAISGNAQLLLKTARQLELDVRRKVEAILQAARRIQHVTGKMETLIQASSISYPGEELILDIDGSVSRNDVVAGTGGTRFPAAPVN